MKDQTDAANGLITLKERPIFIDSVPAYQKLMAENNIEHTTDTYRAYALARQPLHAEIYDKEEKIKELKAKYADAVLCQSEMQKKLAVSERQNLELLKSSKKGLDYYEMYQVSEEQKILLNKQIDESEKKLAEAETVEVKVRAIGDAEWTTQRISRLEHDRLSKLSDERKEEKLKLAVEALEKIKKDADTTYGTAIIDLIIDDTLLKIKQSEG